MSLTAPDVLAALAEIRLPDGSVLPQSGRLTEIIIDAERVMFSIAVEPKELAQMEPVRKAAEALVQRLAGSRTVLIGFTGERPAGRSAPPPPRPQAAAAAPGAAPNSRQIQLPNIRHIIAVASGKGGVGKSTTACNLALALSAKGLKVGVLDADIYGPSMPTLFNLHGKPQVEQGRLLRPLEGYGIKVMSIGFMVDPESAMIWRGPMVMSAITQMLRDVIWGELDVLVVDMPPGTGDAQLTMAQQTPLAGAVIVSTPQDLALVDARRGIAMFKKVEVPILGVVENMSYFCCPNCNHRTDLFGHGGAQKEAERLNVPFLGAVPLDPVIRETSDGGRPITVTEPSGPHAKVYREIADKVWATLSGETPVARRAMPKIVIE